MASEKKVPQDSTSHAVGENDKKGCLHELTGFTKLGQHRVTGIYHEWKNKKKGTDTQCCEENKQEAPLLLAAQ